MGSEAVRCVGASLTHPTNLQTTRRFALLAAFAHAFRPSDGIGLVIDDAADAARLWVRSSRNARGTPRRWRGWNGLVSERRRWLQCQRSVNARQSPLLGLSSAQSIRM